MLGRKIKKPPGCVNQAVFIIQPMLKLIELGKVRLALLHKGRDRFSHFRRRYALHKDFRFVINAVHNFLQIVLHQRFGLAQ